MSSFNIVQKVSEDHTKIARLDEQGFFYQGLILAVSDVLDEPAPWAQDLSKIGVESLIKSLAPEFLSKPYIYGDISTNNKQFVTDSSYRGSAAIKIEISQRNNLSLCVSEDCGAAPNSCAIEYVDDVLLVFTYEQKDEINKQLADMGKAQYTVSTNSFSYHLFFRNTDIDDICAFGQMSIEFKK